MPDILPMWLIAYHQLLLWFSPHLFALLLFEVVWGNYIPRLLHYLACFEPSSLYKWVTTVLFLQWAGLTAHNDRNGHSTAAPLSSIGNNTPDCVVAVTNLLHCFHGLAMCYVYRCKRMGLPWLSSSYGHVLIHCFSAWTHGKQYR